MSVNAKLPETKVGEVKEFIFASLIVVAAFSAGVLIYKNGDSLALTPVDNQAAAVIESYGPAR
jgi:hypothetical protein